MTRTRHASDERRRRTGAGAGSLGASGGSQSSTLTMPTVSSQEREQTWRRCDET